MAIAGIVPNIERKPTLKSYKQIRAELDRLQREADSVRKAESAGVIAKMRKTIEEYGLTAADLGLDAPSSAGASDRPATKAASKPASRPALGRKAAAKKSGRSSAGVAKYHDPASGRSWSGFGRAPAWLASAKDREAFRVGAEAAPRSAAQPESEREPEAVTPPASKKAAKKAGAKAAVKKAASKKAPARKAASAEGRAAAGASAGAEPATDRPMAPTADDATPPA